MGHPASNTACPQARELPPHGTLHLQVTGVQGTDPWGTGGSAPIQHTHTYMHSPELYRASEGLF